MAWVSFVTPSSRYEVAIVSKFSYRIGQIAPSSNTTMETEVPAMFRARETIFPERFTFRSSRMRMKKVHHAPDAHATGAQGACSRRRCSAHAADRPSLRIGGA
jgi:maleate isomerase